MCIQFTYLFIIKSYLCAYSLPICILRSHIYVHTVYLFIHYLVIFMCIQFTFLYIIKSYLCAYSLPIYSLFSHIYVHTVYLFVHY